MKYNEAFFYEIEPKSFAKIYELAVLKLEKQKNLQANDLTITSEQYADIGNACIDYIETIIKENINMVNEKTSMQLLIESNADLQKSQASLEKSSLEAKQSYEKLSNKFDSLLEIIEQHGIDLSKNDTYTPKSTRLVSSFFLTI